MKYMIQTIIVSAVLLFGVAGMAQPAAAQGISVEVRAIAASTKGNSFDPKLKDLERKLKGPAFARYTNFKQVAVTTSSLAKNGSKSVNLPDGSSMKLTFLGYAGKLVKLGVGIPKKLNTTLRLSPGSTFFQAGLRYQSGILILAIRIK